MSFWTPFSWIRPRPGAPIAGTLAMLFALAMPDFAHAVVTVDPYTLAIGWAHEPTYTGAQNAVQVVVTDSSGQPVADLKPGDLQVVVSLGGVTTSPLSLDPTYDEDTGLGTKGDYEAPIQPTAPGSYTFHVTGSVDGTAVDQTVTAGDDTFDPVVGPQAIQFPNQEPGIGDVVTRLDREDSRLGALETGSASTSLVWVAVGVGAVGAVLGLVALGLALRMRRRPTGG